MKSHTNFRLAFYRTLGVLFGSTAVFFFFFKYTLKPDLFDFILFSSLVL